MNGNRRKSILMILLSIGGIFLFSGTLFFLYGQSKFLPFSLAGIFLLLLGIVNLILLIFRSDIPLRTEDIEEERPDTVIEDRRKTIGGPIGRFLERLGAGIRSLPGVMARLYNRLRQPMRLLLLAAALVGAFVWFGAISSGVTGEHMLSYWHLVVLAGMFVLSIVIDKYVKYAEPKDEFIAMLLRNSRAFFTLSKIVTAVAAIAVSICMLGLYDLQHIVRYIYMALFYYVLVMLLISLVVRAIRKELSTKPGIVILLPFFNSDIKDLAVISFLEENTGITLRSLWSIKFIRKMIPVAFFCALLLLWLSTGVVYVESYQKAAVYRFGELQEEILSPGLHLTLPYPIDKTEIYDTESIRKVTIGYRSEEDADNIWTESHGESEYKLLLGSGNELVSINLRVEYMISDLETYLKNSSDPERILEAKAYELATDRTMSQDLATLLSVDREAFAESFRTDLEKAVATSNTGLKVVNVVMESIHPPVEVASVYQKLISAEIDAERMILEAEADAAVALFRAESYSKILLDDADISHYEKIAAARSELAEFMAAVEAYSEYPDAYVYYKYLDAICSTYATTKLVFVGQDVDSSRIKIIYGTLE